MNRRFFSSSASCASAGGGGVALIMGVANHRSIAWACVQEYLAQGTDCILTYHPRFHKHVDRLVASYHQEQQQQQAEQNDTTSKTTTTTTAASNLIGGGRGKILGHFSCQVETDIPKLFQTQLPPLLFNDSSNNNSNNNNNNRRYLNSIVHSIAYADMENQKSLGQASWSAYAQAQQISSFSLIETARCALGQLPAAESSEDDNNNGAATGQSSMLADHASITALSYIGAVRALQPYHIMGPAKAALEANVRGLAAEYGHISNTSTANGTDSGSSNGKNHYKSIRVNAVSAGPVATLSSRGIPDFGHWSRQVAETSPLQRNVTTQEIASTVHFLSSNAASGITGQTIYVDAGYSSVVPIVP